MVDSMDFTKPYIYWIYSAAHALAHNMESIGWLSYWNGPYIEPMLAFSIVLGLYLFIAIFVIFLNIIAAFTISRLLGVITVILWLLPGLLYSFGYPFLSGELPNRFHSSDGILYVGETESALINVFFSFIFGWSITTLVIHIFKLYTNFKNIYDHIWYVIALTAAVFFVVDSNTRYFKEELTKSEKNIQNGITLLDKQLQRIHIMCTTNNNEIRQSGASGLFCQWIPKARFRIWWLSGQVSFSREYGDIPNYESFISEWKDFDKEQIRKDIDTLNQYYCESQSYSGYCTQIPFVLARFTKHEYKPSQKYFLAAEKLMTGIEAHWKQSIRNNKEMEKTKKNSSIKWFFYILFGAIAGGKVANASRSIVGRPHSIYRPLFRKALSIIKVIISYLLSGFYKGYRETIKIAKEILLNTSVAFRRVFNNKFKS